MTRTARHDRVGELGVVGLRARYRAGDVTPEAVVDAVLARIAARGDDAVWITRVPDPEVRAAAAALDPGRIDDLPLFGVPFAVKDNVDVGGLPTTAACPDFGYVPATSAPLVDSLLRAGALLVGKTNLDQFATGLSGARSPYGVPANVHDPELIPGGSSSGSAVAVAAGLVSFAIGTDTAGSGRVPAALNGVVGLKPSIGLVSGTGVVPACHSLDCASVFATTVADGAAVLSAIAGFDPADAWARRLPVPPSAPRGVALAGLRLAVPTGVERWGARGEADAWTAYLTLVEAVGVELVPVDMEPFLEAGRQLYDGAWVAERLQGLDEFVRDRPGSVLPVVCSILEGGREVAGVEAFAGLHRMQELRRLTHAVLGEVDALLTPTVTETFSVAEMVADPVELNTRLGVFTTFTNLLDLCAVAIPAGGPRTAPFGVTVQAIAGRDTFVVGVADALEGLRTGRSRRAVAEDDGFLLAVVGAHLRGMPLHGDLVASQAELVQRTVTASTYRLFALAGTQPPRPGLLRVGRGGAAIEVEVYRLPYSAVGSFLSAVRAPLAIGQVMLADGRLVHGFVCEPEGFDDAEDITSYGGWRAYREAAAVP